MPYPPPPKENGIADLDIHALFLHFERLRQLSFDEVTTITQGNLATTFLDSDRIDFTYDPEASTVVADIVDSSINTSKLADQSVTYAKIQNVTNNKLLGRGVNAGPIQELTIGQGLTLTGTTLSTSAVLDFALILVNGNGDVLTSSNGTVLISG